MERAEVLGVYGDEYAEAYDERFLLSPWAKHSLDFELEVLRGLFDQDTRWLDLCCGTGYVLGQFPDVERTGLDLSPSMLAKAREANPDIELRQGDVCEPVAEWHGHWSVVTCMWNAYCYLASMAEIERFVANMVDYTAEGGSIFLPAITDLEDLRAHTQVDYEQDIDVWGGRIAITGYYWTWDEPTGIVNENMMAVHVGHLVRLLEPHFTTIEVIRYPLFAPGFVSRKGIVATGRRPVGETGDAEIVWQPHPRHPDDLAAEEAAEAEERRMAQEAEAARVAQEAAQREAEAETRREMERLQAEARTARDAARRADEALHAAESEARAAEAHWEAERADLRSIIDGTAKRAEAAEHALEPALRSPDAVLTGPLVRELAHRVTDGRLLAVVKRRAATLVRRG